MAHYCPLVGTFKMHQSGPSLGGGRYLVVKCDSPVHVGSFLLVVTGGFHHVFWVAEQSQVHQLIIQAILLLCTVHTSTNH